MYFIHFDMWLPLLVMMLCSGKCRLCSGVYCKNILSSTAVTIRDLFEWSLFPFSRKTHVRLWLVAQTSHRFHGTITLLKSHAVCLESIFCWKNTELHLWKIKHKPINICKHFVERRRILHCMLDLEAQKCIRLNVIGKLTVFIDLIIKTRNFHAILFIFKITKTLTEFLQIVKCSFFEPSLNSSYKCFFFNF